MSLMIYEMSSTIGSCFDLIKIILYIFPLFKVACLYVAIFSRIYMIKPLILFRLISYLYNYD